MFFQQLEKPLQRLKKPRQQKFIQSTFTASFLLMAGLTAIAQEPVSKDQIDGKLAEVVKLGEAIVENTTTHPMSEEYVGNALNCSSCHLDNGRHCGRDGLYHFAFAGPVFADELQASRRPRSY